MRASPLSRVAFALVAVLAGWPASALGGVSTICTLATDVQSGRQILAEGQCDTRMSPASTIKIAISLMGFDRGVLVSPTAPRLPFREGYIDWRLDWKQPTWPERWMKRSVVWYSQQVTQRLGAARFRRYVETFGYGNRDISGDPGGGDGLTGAWLSSSLAIAPREQAAFLRRLLRGELPVSELAVRHTAAILDHGPQGGGWRLFGKTGTGLQRDAEGELLRGQPFGWFVGWAERDGRRVVFAKLLKASERQPEPLGFRARDSVIADLFGPGGVLN